MLCSELPASNYAGEMLGPVLNRACSWIAARINLESCPRSAVICNPSGSSLPTGIGIEIAGVPSAVQGAFIAGSPAVDMPTGAGPVAADVRINSVDVKNFALLALL